MNGLATDLVRGLTQLYHSPQPVLERIDAALASLTAHWDAFGVVLLAARKLDNLPPIIGYPDSLPLGEFVYRRLTLVVPAVNDATLLEPKGTPDAPDLPPGIHTAYAIPVQPGGDRLATLLVMFGTSEAAGRFDLYAADTAVQLLGMLMQPSRPSEPLSWSDPRVQSVIDIGRSLAATLDISELAPQAYKLIGEILPLDTFFIAYYEPATETLHYRYVIQDGVTFPVQRMPAAGTLAGRVLRAGRTIHFYLPEHDQPEDLLKRVGDGRGLSRSILMVPLFEDGEPVAVVSAQTYEEYAYTAEDEQFLSVIGSYFAIAAHNAGRLASTRAESLTDDLTGLGNRRALRLMMQQCLERHRETGEPQSLILLDADHLKEVNDTYGHLAGDMLLRTIAAKLREHIRGSDSAFRHGGDEFSACLVGVPVGEAVKVAERIAQAVKKAPIEFEGAVFHGSVSVGIAECADTPQAMDKWYDAADRAAYIAKDMSPGTVFVDVGD